MKRLLLIPIVILALAVIAAIALPIVISSDAIRAGLTRRAMEITGREIVFSGDPVLSFRPFMGIEIRDVEFRNGSNEAGREPILAMPKLRAQLSLASALRGKVDITEFRFVRPSFNLKLLPLNQSNWAFREGDIWKILDEARALRDLTPTGESAELSRLANVELGTFHVLDGVVNYENEITGHRETITNLNGKLVWPDTRSAWRFEGGGIWRGDAFEIVSTATQPIMLMAGGTSPITADIRSEPLNLEFEGEANRFADLFINGRLAASSPSLRRAIKLFGGEIAAGSSLSAFEAQGTVSGTLQRFELEPATLSLDGNEGTGVLALDFAHEGKARLSGTIAYPEFDLSPYLIPMRPAKGEVTGPLLVDLFNRLTIDIRVSASSVNIFDVELREFAGSLTTKEGRLWVDIGNAMIQNGMVVGTLNAGRTGQMIGAAVNLTIGPVSPASIGALDGFSAVRLNGPSRIRLKLNTEGVDPTALAGHLSGEFRIEMDEGELRGLDFSAIRASMEDEAGQADNLMLGEAAGKTPVRDLELSGVVNRGVAWIRDSRFSTADHTATLQGKADLRRGNLALWGALSQTDGEAADPVETAKRRFFIGGTLRQPLYVPEVASNPQTVPQPDKPKPEGAIDDQGTGTN